MSGCFGSDPEDRFFEAKLLQHLDHCEDCGKLWDFCQCDMDELDEEEELEVEECSVFAGSKFKSFAYKNGDSSNINRIRNNRTWRTHG